MSSNQIKRAIDLVDFVNEETAKAVLSLENIDLDKPDDVKILLIEANLLNRDLHRVWYKLRKIAIATYGRGKSPSDLNPVSFNALARNLHGLVNKSTEDLKDSLKTTLTGLAPQVDELFQVVKNENSNDSKRDIVDVINILANAVENVSLRNNYHNLSFSDIQKSLNNIHDYLGNAVESVISDDQYTIRNLIDWIRYGTHQVYNVEEKLFEDALECNEKNLQDSILKVSHEINEALHALDKAHRYKNSLKHLQLNINVCRHKLIDLLFDTLAVMINSEDSPSNHNKLLFYVIQTLSLANAFVRGLNHVTSVQESV